MRNKYLLGATHDNEIVFAEIEVTTRNGYPEFTASFNCVRPFTADEVDATEYYESLIDEMDKEWKYDQCEHYDCAPSDLAERLAEENGEDVTDTRDCSLYNETINIDGVEWYFQSGSCGQHDTRGEMKAYTNRSAYNQIHGLWDKYHLKAVDQAVIEKVNQIGKTLAKIDETEWISDYVQANFD